MKKMILIIIGLLWGISNSSFGAAETLYLRSDDVLGDASSTYTEIGMWYDPLPVTITANIYIVHQDTSTTQIGNGVFVNSLSSGSPGADEYTSTFNCPATSMLSTDKIRIVEDLEGGGTHTWTSASLGVAGLANTTWTIYRWMDYSDDNEEGYYFYGISPYDTRIEGISYVLQSQNPQMLL